ncbi:MAG: cation:proton antiporter [Campylobacterales bacterium]|nr:cation:proton antiporter [Campylobacterales bacterium]
MLEIFSILLTLILISKYIEDRTKVSFVLIIIVLAYVSSSFFNLSLLKENFHSIIYLMLPIILIPDVLGLSSNELKENKSSIFFLSVIAVFASIALAVGISYFSNYFETLSLAYLLLLFTPLMATDVVSVGAIFTKFNLPSHLKLYAEGESLFNDITAMVLFFFIALPLAHGDDILISSLMTLTLSTVFFSLVLGLGFGFLGYFTFNNSRDNLEEFITVYLMASFSFLLAEHFKLSGILSVIVSVIAFKYFFNQAGHYKKRNIFAAYLHLNKKSNATLSLRAYIKESHYLGFFANAVIFTSIATVIDLELLFRYKYEILYVFVLTTAIRYLMMFLFINYKKHPLHWTNILTLSGMKGGLALIMVISLGDDFLYKEMFVTTTLGVVILSIFVNTFFLMLYLHFNKEHLLLDKADEHHIAISDVKEIFQKEPLTKAYNEIIFEDLIENEIERASRYNQQFVIVAFHATSTTAHAVGSSMVRKGDYFGKLDAYTYAILMPHTSLEDILGFSQRLELATNNASLSIAQYMPNDTKELIYEKLFSGFAHKNKIAIEI